MFEIVIIIAKIVNYISYPNPIGYPLQKLVLHFPISKEMDLVHHCLKYNLKCFYCFSHYNNFSN